MQDIEIKNAIIESAEINDGERGLLTAWLHLDYGGSGQGFGGHALYLPDSFTHSKNQANYAGHFIFRCMQIAGVSSWKDMKGKTIRAKCNWSKVEAIGHIVKDDWFSPEEDFRKM